MVTLLIQCEVLYLSIPWPNPDFLTLDVTK